MLKKSPQLVGPSASPLFVNLVQVFVGILALSFGSVYAAPVDLNDWTATSGGNWAGGSWHFTGPEIGEVDREGVGVRQVSDSNPAMFISDFDAFGTKVTGTLRAPGADGDFIGFVIGFQPGDEQNAQADYLLLDWKKLSQPIFGGTAQRGMFLSRVSGVPSISDFWLHDGAITPLAFGPSITTQSGWVNGGEYEFEIDFGPNDLMVKIDGITEFNVSGSFSNGRLGLYSHSNAGVEYRQLDVDVGSFTVPVPAAAWLFFSALGGLIVVKRKQLKT